MTTKHGFSGPLEALADLPVGWRPVRLRYRLSRNDGGIWGSDDDEGGTIVLRSTEVALDGSWRLDDPARRRLSPAERLAATLHAGDLVVTKSSGSPDHLGKAAVVTHEIAEMNCAFSNFMQRLRPSRDNDSKYLFWFLNSPLGRDQMNYFGSTTTGLRNLGAAILGDLILPGASPAQQRVISTFLDGKTAAIDALITKKERLIGLLGEKRQALITQAITKGLDPTVPMKYSGVEWLGDIPAHWGMERIASISTKITNGFVGPTRDILVDEGVRYLQSLHIKGNQIRFTDDNEYFVTPTWSRAHAKSVLNDGDVLVVQTGDIGQVACVPPEFEGSNCHALIIISPVTSVLRGPYLSWTLNSVYGQNSLKAIQTGALHPHLNCTFVREVVVPIPPLAEQMKIMEFIGQQDSATSRLQERNRIAVDLLREYRQALISAAVTGMIGIPAEEAA